MEALHFHPSDCLAFLDWAVGSATGRITQLVAPVTAPNLSSVSETIAQPLRRHGERTMNALKTFRGSAAFSFTNISSYRLGDCGELLGMTGWQK
jgi:hypothetical protein